MANSAPGAVQHFRGPVPSVGQRTHTPPDPGHRWGQPLTLVTVLPLVAGRTRLPTLAADGVTGYALRAGTRL